MLFHMSLFRFIEEGARELLEINLLLIFEKEKKVRTTQYSTKISSLLLFSNTIVQIQQKVIVMHVIGWRHTNVYHDNLLWGRPFHNTELTRATLS